MAAGYDGSIRIDTKIDQKGAQSGLKTLTGSLKSFAAVAGAAFGVAAIIKFGKDSVNAANELSNALTGLKSIADGTGKSFDEAQKFIDEYTKDGLVPATNAVTAYKNLLARGYDTKQIQDVMNRLKDSAAFGRQASYSLGDAVQSATEGLKNENSILVDNAGVTKNVAKMWDDYAKSIGTTSNNLTQAQKVQAEYVGIMNETRWQVGDAQKMSQTYSGQVSQLAFNFNNLKVALGNAIIPVLRAILPYINSAINGITVLANKLAALSQGIFGKVTPADNVSKTADSVNELADATEDAGKKAKKTSNQFASFDEIKTLASGTDGDSAAVTAGNEISGVAGTVSGLSKEPDLAWLDSARSRLSDFGAFVEKTFGPSISSWGKAFNSLKAPITDAAASVGKSLGSLWKNTLAPLGSYIVTDYVPSIANSFSKTFAPIFEQVMPVLLDEFSKDFAFSVELIDRVIKDIYMPALETVKKISMDVFDGIKKAWDNHGAGILEGFTNFRESVREIWTSIYENVIAPVFGYIGDTVNWLWDKHLKPLWDNISDFFGSVGEFVLMLWNEFLAPFVDFIVKNLGPPIAFVFGMIADVFGTTFGMIADVVGGILKALGGLLDFLTGVFTGNWKKAWDGIKNFFIGIWDAIWGVVKGTVNLVIDGINLLWGGIYTVVKGIVDGIGGIAGAIGSLFGQDWKFSMPAKVPKIPKLAQGAVIPPNREFLAVLGDQKQGTNIETPAKLMEDIFRKVAAELGLGGQQGDIYVYIGNEQLDGHIVRVVRGGDIRGNGRLAPI